MDCYYHNYFSHNSPQNDNNGEHNNLSRDCYHPSYINKDHDTYLLYYVNEHDDLD